MHIKATPFLSEQVLVKRGGASIPEYPYPAECFIFSLLELEMHTICEDARMPLP